MYTRNGETLKQEGGSSNTEKAMIRQPGRKNPQNHRREDQKGILAFWLGYWKARIATPKKEFVLF
jgi:hypothetical protein